jgi:DNA invertase Pin-like site-specific DNA recombinase
MLLDGYVRVSRVGGRKGDRFISPKVQREQIATWASNHSAILGEVFEEMDKSGADIDRPLLQRALERIETGRSEGLIVYKLNRFARSLIDGLSLIARIQEAGGTFISVEDGLDLKTPTGKLSLRILFSVAEWEYEQSRENWQIARENAVQRGVYCSTKPPIGYRRDSGGRLHTDPETIAVIAEVFRRRGEGASLRHLARYLNEKGIPSNSGMPIHGGNVARMVKNRAYLGESWAGAVVNTSAHSRWSMSRPGSAPSSVVTTAPRP